jgi:hypothetical protein
VVRGVAISGFLYELKRPHQVLHRGDGVWIRADGHSEFTV